MKDNEPEQEADMSEASGGSIFLGFESSSRLEMEETSAEAAAGSVPSVASKTAGAGSSFASARIDTEPKIELLWSFQCPLSVAYNVTAIDWNKTNQVQHMHLAIVTVAEAAEFGGSSELRSSVNFCCCHRTWICTVVPCVICCVSSKRNEGQNT